MKCVATPLGVQMFNGNIGYRKQVNYRKQFHSATLLTRIRLIIYKQYQVRSFSLFLSFITVLNYLFTCFFRVFL